MSRRIDIELTSTREDGSWTWRAAGAREPRGTLEGDILPRGAEVGSVLRAEVEGFLDGLSVVAVLPPRAPRNEPERLELKTSRSDQPLVTSTVAPKRSGERSPRNDRGRDGRDRREGRDGRDGREGRDGGEGRRERRGPRDRDRDRDRGRDRSAGRHERPARPAPPPVEAKPKPKRLRPGKAHRTALLEAVPAEQRPIAEQLLAGGIPSVRQAIDKQNAELKAAGKPEVKPDALLRVAEELRPKALAAVWRDRAEAAVAVIDDLDLRDLRSVVNAAGDAGRDEEARALATSLREALTVRVEKEQADWLAELAETVKAGRVVRALRLSSRPPKAGSPIPGDIATQLAEATAASLTDETGPERWATVLDALAYSPVRRRVIPQSLPAKLSPDLRATISRLASRLPEIAHIFDIEPDPAAERAARGQARRRPGDRKDGGRKEAGRKDRDGARKGGDGARKADRPRKPKAADQPAADQPAAKAGDKPAAKAGDKPAANAGRAPGAPSAEPAAESGDAATFTEAPAESGDAATSTESGDAATSTDEPAAESGDAATSTDEPAAESGDAATSTESGDAATSTESGDAATSTESGDAATSAESGDAATFTEPAAESSDAATSADETAPAVHATSAAEEMSSVEDESEPEARTGAGGTAHTAEPTEVSATEANTGDEPTAANGSAAAGDTGDADEGETGAGEPAADETAAEAQPQS